MMDHPDYQALAAVLQAAYDQASAGKGAERHARGNPFHEQHMQSISNLLDSDRGMAFQAIKKLTEGLDFTDPDRRERELLGVIVYVAGIIVWHRGRQQQTLEDFGNCAHCGAFLVGADIERHTCDPAVYGNLEAEASQQAHMDTLVGQFLDTVATRAPTAELKAILNSCPDCGAPEGDLHYVLCPRLPVPEAHAQAVEEAFAAEQVVTDMSDWRNWRIGDLVEINNVDGNSGHEFISGDVVRIRAIGEYEDTRFRCEYQDMRDFWFIHESEATWHSRPQAEQFDESRADIIGQNGNDAAVYDELPKYKIKKHRAKTDK